MIVWRRYISPSLSVMPENSRMCSSMVSMPPTGRLRHLASSITWLSTPYSPENLPYLGSPIIIAIAQGLRFSQKVEEPEPIRKRVAYVLGSILARTVVPFGYLAAVDSGFVKRSPRFGSISNQNWFDWRMAFSTAGGNFQFRSGNECTLPSR